MKIAYITDSATCEDSIYFADKGIFSLPLQVAIDGKNYLDREEITAKDVIDALARDAKITTSLPPLGLIAKLFEDIKAQGFDKIVAVPIGANLSGTANAVRLEAENSGLPFEFVEIYTAAYFQKAIVEFLAKESAEGIALEESLKVVEKAIHSPGTNTIVIPKSLKQLRNSGRLAPSAYHVAEFLGIKPILGLNISTSGKVDILQKVRTFNKALDKLLQQMHEEIDQKVPYSIFVAHADNTEDAESLAERIRSEFPNAVVEVAELCAPIACHVGLGALCVQYFPTLLRK